MTEPVLVAGAGPVGLTMAAELARYRVPVRIIDKMPTRTDKSKALVVWARTLELLDRAGCAEAFAASGVHGEAMHMLSGSRTIARIAFDRIASPFPYALLLPQSETERLLESHLESLGTKVERGVELTEFSQTAQGVSCNLRRADGTAETHAASWLIGCDGAHSFVRQHLRMAFEGNTLTTHFILADLHVTGLGISQTEMALFLHAEGLLVFFPIAPGRYRLIADVGTEPRHDPDLAEVQRIVDRRGPGGVALSQPVWLAGFAVNERKVSEYRAGRIFLAGDAAHIHSPAGGQGMNTGMQDAINLAWKLALVAHGRAGEHLLNSYSLERSPVARQVLADSGKLTAMATLRNPVAQNLRNAAAHFLLGFSGVQHAMANRLSEITIGYGGIGKAPREAKPGQRIIGERPFGAGDMPRFALIAADDAAARGVLQRHPELLEPELRAEPAAPGTWLVRPDGYVAAVSAPGEWSAIEGYLVSMSVS